MVTESDLQFNLSVWEWTARTLSFLEKVLKVNIKLHISGDQLEQGDIFLFNHFARFETFIPQWLFYRETGVLSRSVAAAEFFREGDPFSEYLLNLGGVPTNYPKLLPFLAAELFRGRKVLLFPEGGMVKDRRVIDPKGHYSIYSRSALERRKHHTGAAVLGLAVDGFKEAVLASEAMGRTERIETWARQLGLEDPGSLLTAARKPTSIIPANITFYPIRVTGNLLQKGAELFSGGLSPRLAEELLIEGNILLKDTDMDIRLGDPVRPSDFWRWWERRLLRRVARRAESLQDFFSFRNPSARWDARLFDRCVRRTALHVRDTYMEGMYEGVTVNLSHLASVLIFRLLDRGHTAVEEESFRLMLYCAVKFLQREGGVHRHRSLENPESYRGLLAGECRGFDQYLEAAVSSKLLERLEGRYRFLPKLRQEYAFDQVRIENSVVVYANEAAPILPVKRAVDRALDGSAALSAEERARLRFDDELRAYRWEREAFRKPRHEAVNREETATLGGEPFLSIPAEPRSLGVVLLHGFSASPAEMRPFGEVLERAGYPVCGVRLKGHGTSPWDFLERRWTDWLDSARIGLEVLAPFARSVCLVGFSAGGALALRLAAERPAGLAGVVTVSAPVRLRDRSMAFVPFVDGANRVLRSVSPLEGVMLFHHANPEHPEINYRHMPIRALHELQHLIGDVEEHLAEVSCPVLLVQGLGDPTVDPQSAEILFEGLSSPLKLLALMPSDRHGILYDDREGTQQSVLEFLAWLERREAGQPADEGPEWLASLETPRLPAGGPGEAR